MTQLRIPAVYMRGGTSKGVFFLANDLPQHPVERDRVLLRVMGSPDRYGMQIDGMGGATSSTSKVAIVAKSLRSDSDVDYLFGAVAVDKPVIDWSGNCGNLTAAVAPFAIARGLVTAPAQGEAIVRIWQANIKKRIVAHVPMSNGEVKEDGDFELDGVTFPGAEIRLEFLDPGGAEGEESSMFPSGALLDSLEVPGAGVIEATLINAGNPTIFVEAASLGLRGSELQSDVNNNLQLLALAEAIRATAAVTMGLAASKEEVTSTRPHTPKLALIAKPQSYLSSDLKMIDAKAIDMLVRIFSMGKLHHAITGTGAVATAVAAAIPGTLVHRVCPANGNGRIRLGHPSGVVVVGAEASEHDGKWNVTKALMSRSARHLMEGWVRVPGFNGGHNAIGL
jgi:probable AcnD-accessory protein PrpF